MVTNQVRVATIEPIESEVPGLARNLEIKNNLGCCDTHDIAFIDS